VTNAVEQVVRGDQGMVQPGSRFPRGLLLALGFGVAFGLAGFIWALVPALAALPGSPVVTALGAGLVGAVLGSWVAYRRPTRRTGELPRLVGLSFGFGAVFGFVGLICGFVGPTILNPSSNLAPIIGILVTGPGGFFVGVVVGLWVAYHRLSFEASFGALAVGSLFVALASLALSLP
jgi:hypothetical protein